MGERVGASEGGREGERVGGREGGREGEVGGESAIKLIGLKFWKLTHFEEKIHIKISRNIEIIQTLKNLKS